ncbi:ABC transporter permease [Hoeflea sp. E7-10]|uniref:Transport permease protein n=2 Tax=Hoeflea poritis TaxID=2993659 RepID=A0ABT4VPB6_9HYPH|nr:ABC transporter permease [Hoeflea poritis]
MTLPYEGHNGEPQQWTFRSRFSLAMQLVRREVVGRYKGSMLGILWSLLTPLFMLGVYTFVFGMVFKARWAGAAEDTSMAEFAITLFAGLIMFQLFAEVVSRAPMLVLSNPNYVKKIVFPLETLVPVALGAALFHTGLSLVVLIVFMLPVYGSVPMTALLLPLVLVPYCLSILGLSWFLASFGTYVRDIGQILGTIITALMFLSPIFFPLSALPDWLQPWLALNPIALPVEQARNVLLFGQLPDMGPLALYSLASLALAVLGFQFFQKTRKGFADVL